MRGNPDDLANQLIQKIKKYLQEEVDDIDLMGLTVGQEDALFSDYYMNGRKEFAEGLLNQINRWESEEEEQGTVYTGDAPSTEASFYKKSEVEDLDNQSYSEGEEY